MHIGGQKYSLSNSDQAGVQIIIQGPVVHPHFHLIHSAFPSLVSGIGRLPDVHPLTPSIFPH